VRVHIAPSPGPFLGWEETSLFTPYPQEPPSPTLHPDPGYANEFFQTFITPMVKSEASVLRLLISSYGGNGRRRSLKGVRFQVSNEPGQTHGGCGSQPFLRRQGVRRCGTHHFDDTL